MKLEVLWNLRSPLLMELSFSTSGYDQNSNFVQPALPLVALVHSACLTTRYIVISPKSRSNRPIVFLAYSRCTYPWHTIMGATFCAPCP